MSIEKIKRKKGFIYRARIWNNYHPIKSANFTTKLNAERWERNQKLKISEEKYFPSNIKPCTLNELFLKWLENHANHNKAHSSIIGDKQRYNAYLKKTIGNLKANEVSPDHIELIINKLKKNGRLKNATINKILELAKALFNYGIKKRHLEFNPLNAISKLPLDIQGFDFWSQEDATAFLQYTNKKYQTIREPYVLYLIALSTGMRLGEIIGLPFSCIDFQRRLIIVSHTYDKTCREIRNTTKGKRSRYIGINENLFGELVELKNKEHAKHVFETKKGVFIDQDNFRKYNFRKDILESGVKKIRIHDMRHTFASHYIMNGGNIFDLQQILGHADTKTTMRYAHLTPTHIAHTANIVNFTNSNPNLPNVVSFSQK